MRSLAALSLVLLAIGACVGEDPTLSVAPPPSAPAPPGDDSGVRDDAGDGADAGDAGLPDACAAPLEACGASCVDLNTASAHCGACGRDCGGGACTAGQCAPTTFAANVERPYGVATSPNAIFWIRGGAPETEGAVESCKSTGCGPQPTLVTKVQAPFEPRPTGSTIATDGTRLQFIAGHPRPPGTGSGGWHDVNDLYRCSASLCNGTTFNDPYSSARQLVRVEKLLYHRSSKGALLRCPFGACAMDHPDTYNVSGGSDDAGFTATPTEVFFSIGGDQVFRRGLDQTSPMDPIFRAPGAKFMTTAGTWIIAAANEAVNGETQTSLIGCDSATPCAGQPTLFATGFGAITAMAGSSTTVFLARAGASDEATGDILACPTTGCAGGLVTIAKGQARPVSLAVREDTWLFWANEGVDGEPGSIQRLRL